VKAIGGKAVNSDRAAGSAMKRFLRPFVPQGVRRERDIIRRLGPKAGRTYAGLRLRGILGLGWSGSVRVPQSARHFVFVCHGNIMRSPAAEAMFKRALATANLHDRIDVVSAGLHAVVGTPAHPRAQSIACEMGLALSGHRARLLSADLVEWADVIFVMDYQNQAELSDRHPCARHKLFLLGVYASPPQQSREIRDPYFGDLETTRQCFRTLQVCIHNLVAELLPQTAERAKKAVVAV